MSSSTMRIAIAGGTGTLGRPVAAELSERGHEVRVLSRHAPEYQVDLTTGAGLAAALDGCQVVVDAGAVGVIADGGAWAGRGARHTE